MVCRCRTPQEHADRAVAQSQSSARSTQVRLEGERDEALKSLADLTPDASRFEVVDVAEVNTHLVLKVRYESCVRCAFEGTKVMVYLGVCAIDALRWRRIDPHFADDTPATMVHDAPSPAARFPATPSGWADALSYCQGKGSL